MKVAIVTGGSSGIGAATAKELAKRGWQVAIMFSRKREPAEKIARECGNALAIQGDISKDADCRRVAQEVRGKWGRIDALVNNAGTTKFVKHAELDGLSGEDFLEVLRVNVVGTFQMTRACAAALKESRGCAVIVSSVAALLGTGSSIAYAASKAALNTMSFSLARVLAPEVRVNVVAPGFVKTPWQVAWHGDEGVAQAERRYAEMAPLKAAPTTQDVAETIAWLVEGARSVTGEVICVDGGIHIASPR